jgi:hypothetical protein
MTSVKPNAPDIRTDAIIDSRSNSGIERYLAKPMTEYPGRKSIRMVLRPASKILSMEHHESTGYT